MVVIKCYLCGKEHYKSPKEIMTNKHNFCSANCLKIFQKDNPANPFQRVWVNCDFCGKSYWVHKCRDGTTKHSFCSHKCKGEHQSKHYVGENHHHWSRFKVFCNWCGMSFLTTQGKLDAGRGRFCSSDCMYAWNARRMSVVRIGSNNPNWQGGLSYEPYPIEFNDELKLSIRKRDSYICQTCGKTEDETGTLHIHHIDKNKKNNAPINLISLCVHCHVSRHRRKDKEGLLVLETGGDVGAQLRVPRV